MLCQVRNISDMTAVLVYYFIFEMFAVGFGLIVFKVLYSFFKYMFTKIIR